MEREFDPNEEQNENEENKQIPKQPANYPFTSNTLKYQPTASTFTNCMVYENPQQRLAKSLNSDKTIPTLPSVICEDCGLIGCGGNRDDSDEDDEI